MTSTTETPPDGDPRYERVSRYQVAQLALLLERVIEIITRYRSGDADMWEVNGVIEQYCAAEQALSRWAVTGEPASRVAFLERPGAATFDWWGAANRQFDAEINDAVAHRESRDRELRLVRWPWSKAQRSDSSKG